MSKKRRGFSEAIGHALLFGLCVSILTGCSHYNGLRDYHGHPRHRKGAVPCHSFPNKFIEPHRLGKHHYHYSLEERSGIVYTTKAGHVDIPHLRKSADWTAYLAGMSLENILAEKRHWRFSLTEPTRYYVTLDYPADWASLENRDEIAEEVAIQLGEYFAYNGTVWHEMLTWFGYKSSRVVPEFASAFSWEDGFSNLLGTTLAATALRDKEHGYDEAMTLLLNDRLESLDVQPMKVAQQIAKDANGKWYVTRFPIFMYVIQRNLDIGEDGSVQSLTNEGEGISIPIPQKNWGDHGFKMAVEIDPRGFRSRGVRKQLAKDRLTPEDDFTTLLDFIERDAKRRGYEVMR